MNWKRSTEEVGALMALFRVYLKKIIQVANANNVKVTTIGERSRFDADIIAGIDEMEEATKQNTGMVFCIAINYGGRDEITRAVRRLAGKAKDGELSPEDITEQMISDEIDTSGMPDPDLLIRTAGEQRLSNFLLWQSAYTEFYYTDIYWPDFNKAELIKAIEAYNNRDRRFGGRK